MKWVYSAGTEKPKPIPVIEQIKPKAGLFSSLLEFSRSTPQRAPSPLPPQPVIKETEYLKIDQSSIVLMIFTADVEVKLSPKISTELLRSTKKNPPRALKYELIYVSPPSSIPPHHVSETLMHLSDRERTNMMRARKRMTLSPRQQGVFSRVCAPTWTGKCDHKL
jgi:hypothetical protein